MKENKNKTFKILFIILLLVVIIGIVLYFGKDYFEKKKAQSLIETYESLVLEFNNESDIVEIEYGLDSYDPMNIVKDVNEEIIIKPAKIDTRVLKEIDVVYTIIKIDTSNLEVKKEFTKTFSVKDSQKPIIEILNKEINIYEGEEFDIDKNIKVYDVVDGDLKYCKILVNNSYTFEIDYIDKVDQYQVKIFARDINGLENEDSFIINVIVKEEVKKDNEPNTDSVNNNKDDIVIEEKEDIKIEVPNNNKEDAVIEASEKEKPEETISQNEIVEEDNNDEKKEEVSQEEIVDNNLQVEEEPVDNNTKDEEEEFVEMVAEEPITWNGNKLSKFAGVCEGPSGKETYYNLNMNGVIAGMRALGYDEENYPYWIRDDGCKMLGGYIMVAANYDIRPKGTHVETSLGWGIVCDTGGFASEKRV